MNEPILFIDDDPNLLAAMERQLKKSFNIALARGGDEALAALYHAESRQEPFAVVVCDMRMPGMDGIEVLKRIKDQFPDTVRIMLTGKADPQVAMNAINKDNVFRFFIKPYKPEELVEGLNEALVQYRTAKAERELLERLGYPRAKVVPMPIFGGTEPGRMSEAGGSSPAVTPATDPAEAERLLRLAAAAEAKKDIQDMVGYDIVNHDRLIALADNIWREVPAKKRASYTTADWQVAIYEKCKDALLKAEKKLAETNPEPRMLKANINILRSAFARQVVRAMQEIAAHYRDYQAKSGAK